MKVTQEKANAIKADKRVIHKRICDIRDEIELGITSPIDAMPMLLFHSQKSPYEEIRLFAYDTYLWMIHMFISSKITTRTHNGRREVSLHKESWWRSLLLSLRNSP